MLLLQCDYCATQVKVELLVLELIDGYSTRGATTQRRWSRQPSRTRKNKLVHVDITSGIIDVIRLFTSAARPLCPRQIRHHHLL